MFQLEIDQIRKDLAESKERITALTQSNSRLHAEVLHWQTLQIKTQQAGHEALVKMHQLVANTVTQAVRDVQEFGEDRRKAGCHDCDVKALVSRIEALRPLTLESRRVPPSGSYTPPEAG